MLINHQYKIEKEIGRGGMGTVYRAFNVETNTLVAIKETIILPSAEEQRQLKRLQREYKFLRSIQHPNIVRAIDFFEYQNTYYIVMEYVDGYSLEELVQERSYSITVEEQLQIVVQICDAIATLNERGVIHRDMKPANIIMCKYRGIPKVLDLGIAKDLQQTSTVLTRAGYTIGTFSYMSPEQLTTGASDKSDSFSLGAMFYQFFLWQSQSPYYAKNLGHAIKNISEKTLPSLALTAQNPHDLHPQISEIIDAALLHDVEQRISVREMHIRFAKLTGKEIEPSNTVVKSSHHNAKKITSRTRRLDAAKKNRQKIPQPHQLTAILNKDLLFRALYTIIILTLTYFVYNNSVLDKMEKNQEVKYLYLAQSAFQKQQYQEAIHYYEKELQINPQNADAHLGKARSYIQIQRYSPALKSINNAIKIKPTSQRFYHRGHVYFFMSNNQQAINDLNKAIEMDKRNVSAYLLLRRIHNIHNKHDLAIKTCKRALEVFPDHSSFHFLCGLHLASLQKSSQALDHFVIAAKSNNDPESLRNYAIIYLRLKKYLQAFEAISKAIGLQNDKADYYEIRIKAAKKLNNHEAILQDYSHLIQINASNAIYYEQRGIFYYKTKQYENAITDFSKSIVLKPLYEVYQLRGQSYAKINQHFLALADYNKAIHLQPKAHLSYLRRGISHVALKHYSQAISDYKTVIRLYPDLPDVYFYLYMCYSKMKLKSIAAKYYRMWIQKK